MMLKEQNMSKVAINPRSSSYREAQKVVTELSGECPLDHAPNAETITAIEEGRAMLAGKLPHRHFKSFEEFWKDLNS
jgi:hypothetical protein